MIVTNALSIDHKSQLHLITYNIGNIIKGLYEWSHIKRNE